MDSIERLQRRFDEWKNDPDYLYYGLVYDFTEDVVARMIAGNVRRRDLADRLGTSRAWVTKLLDGQENMTLKTMVRVANALDMNVEAKLVPRPAAKPKRRTTARSTGRRPARSPAPAKKRTRAVATRSRR